MADPAQEDQETLEPDESAPANFPALPEEAPRLSTGADAGATQALAGFLKLTPFIDLHQKAGDESGHRFRGWLCFTLDTLIRLVVIVLILAIIVTVAWKTLAPVPVPWGCLS